MNVRVFLFICLVVFISVGSPGLCAQDNQSARVALEIGESAPDFSLPAVSGEVISLSDYAGKHNVVLSFVPAAWTPVCSQQWPGYNIAEDYFTKNNAVLLGITVDNTPTQSAWIKDMGGLCFPVLSDFWPHGAVAESYGVLRSEGVAERAVFIIDTSGIIRYIDIHDIHEQPDLEILIKELERIADTEPQEE